MAEKDSNTAPQDTAGQPVAGRRPIILPPARGEGEKPFSGVAVRAEETARIKEEAEKAKAAEEEKTQENGEGAPATAEEPKPEDELPYSRSNRVNPEVERLFEDLPPVVAATPDTISTVRIEEIEDQLEHERVQREETPAQPAPAPKEDIFADSLKHLEDGVDLDIPTYLRVADTSEISIVPPAASPFSVDANQAAFPLSVTQGHVFNAEVNFSGSSAKVLEYLIEQSIDPSELSITQGEIVDGHRITTVTAKNVHTLDSKGYESLDQLVKVVSEILPAEAIAEPFRTKAEAAVAQESQQQQQEIQPQPEDTAMTTEVEILSVNANEDFGFAITFNGTVEDIEKYLGHQGLELQHANVRSNFNPAGNYITVTPTQIAGGNDEADRLNNAILAFAVSQLPEEKVAPKFRGFTVEKADETKAAPEEILATAAPITFGTSLKEEARDAQGESSPAEEAREQIPLRTTRVVIKTTPTPPQRFESTVRIQIPSGDKTRHTVASPSMAPGLAPREEVEKDVFADLDEPTAAPVVSEPEEATPTPATPPFKAHSIRENDQYLVLNFANPEGRKIPELKEYLRENDIETKGLQIGIRNEEQDNEPVITIGFKNPKEEATIIVNLELIGFVADQLPDDKMPARIAALKTPVIEPEAKAKEVEVDVLEPEAKPEPIPAPAPVIEVAKPKFNLWKALTDSKYVAPWVEARQAKAKEAAAAKALETPTPVGEPKTIIGKGFRLGAQAIDWLSDRAQSSAKKAPKEASAEAPKEKTKWTKIFAPNYKTPWVAAREEKAKLAKAAQAAKAEEPAPVKEPKTFFGKAIQKGIQSGAQAIENLSNKAQADAGKSKLSHDQQKRLGRGLVAAAALTIVAVPTIRIVGDKLFAKDPKAPTSDIQEIIAAERASGATIVQGLGQTQYSVNDGIINKFTTQGKETITIDAYLKDVQNVVRDNPAIAKNMLAIPTKSREFLPAQAAVLAKWLEANLSKFDEPAVDQTKQR